MISPLTPTQAEIDAQLLKRGIKCQQRKTKDGSHMLYEDAQGSPITLPCSIDGYSYYAFEQILAFVNAQVPNGDAKDQETYKAQKGAKLSVVGKPEIK